MPQVWVREGGYWLRIEALSVLKDLMKQGLTKHEAIAWLANIPDESLQLKDPTKRRQNP